MHWHSFVFHLLFIFLLYISKNHKATAISLKNKTKASSGLYLISMPVHERQTPNSGHNHYWSLRRLGHIVKGHHQHNRHAVATKTDVKLKKKRRKWRKTKTKMKLWAGNTWFGAKRAYKLMKSRDWASDWCGARSLSFPLNWNAWMNEPMNEGHQRNNYNTAHELNWALFYHSVSIGRGARFTCIVFVVCVKPTTIIICSGHTHTHTQLLLSRDPKTHIRARARMGPLPLTTAKRNTTTKKKWVRKPMEQPATST